MVKVISSACVRSGGVNCSFGLLLTIQIMGWFRWLARLAVLVILFYVIVNYWLKNKSYVIRERDVISIAEKHQGPNVKQAFRRIVTDLRQKYPGHILPDDQLQFIFVNAGGWMGSMCVLHASLTEYVLFFGTAVDTSGHSGRYWANITDTIIKGKFVQWKEGSLLSEEFGAGQTVRHLSGEATAVMWSRDTWMLEYGRGFIPSTVPFAVSDTVFGTQDVYTLFSTLRVYSRALLQEFALEFAVVNDRVQRWLKKWL